ncbi:hypothetical protein [Paracoccus lutimaris]|uniref:Argininosuccinate lyase n=1 Tax=Paracoccus lutimaris TaxID=1490030 RepID=A0A368YV83_9RHOB|nr:hypothetical protein [Paracoccus lutimaris]RCW82104.1 hypothetical protein DFP89_11364 [Paracoccus lutimaris]
MTRSLRLTALAALLALSAACGVDGPPTRPEPAPEPGLTVSGEARVGVVSTL